MITISYRDFHEEEVDNLKSITIPERVKSLNIKDYYIDSLDGIERLTSLEYLWIEDCPSLTSLKGVESLSKLISVKVDSTSITSIDEVKERTDMEYLHITNNKLTLIPEWIVNFTRLVSISFKGNSIKAVPFDLFESICDLLDG